MAIPIEPTRDRVRPALEVRTLLAERPDSVKCHAECPGWIISQVNDWRTFVIERCDECDENAKAAGLPYLGWDDDAEQLPEARRALAEALAGSGLSARDAELVLREHALVTALANIIAHCDGRTLDVPPLRRIREIATTAVESRPAWTCGISKET